MPIISKNRLLFIFRVVVVLLLILIYAGYLINVITAPFGPVDFETFRSIGQRFINGANPYGENSYYPMPFVGIFSLLAHLPRSVAAVLWLGVPVFIAFAISGWSPLILIFSPLFAHFVGGQSAVLGMLAVWALRRHTNSVFTGILLAFSTIKPQLAFVPILWAFIYWVRSFRRTGRVPSQFYVFSVSVILIWLPWFLIRPDWVAEWLANPRPLFERAMAGFIPRLLVIVNVHQFMFWTLLITAAIVLLLLMRKSITLDTTLLIWFIVSPLMHDYDLIQLIPLLDTVRKRWLAVIAGLPLLIVILVAYEVDTAWIACTIISPVLLFLHHARILQKFRLSKTKRLLRLSRI